MTRRVARSVLHTLCIGILITLTSCQTPEPLATLTILHTNDFHSRHLPINAFGALCGEADAGQGKCIGGSARLAATIADQRAAVKAVGGASITLDAGDQFQGSLFYTQYRGGTEQAVMNHIGYDAMAVGNHEFDNGPLVLGTFIRGLKFPALSANMDVSAEPALRDLVRPYTIATTKAGPIGIIGLTTEDTPILSGSGANVKFRAAEDVLPPIIEELTRKGIKRIVVVGHMGIDRDREIAKRVAGIDVIVGGHSHTLLSNAAKETQGPYPTIEKGPTGQNVLIVQTGSHGRYLGRIDVTFDMEGKPVSWNGDTIPLAQSLREDQDVKAMLAKQGEPIAMLRKMEVGQTSVNLTQMECRERECPMGDLVTDAMLEATKATGTEIAITNGGGLRAGIGQGTITMGDILTVLPFQNTVATLKLKGADLRAALEHGLSGIEQNQGRFPQVSGLRYVFSTSRPPGSRVIEVLVRDSGGTYRPLDDSKLYLIATNDFIRKGGDGYAIMRDKAIDPYDFGPNLEDMTADYVRRHTPIALPAAGRIERR